MSDELTRSSTGADPQLEICESGYFKRPLIKAGTGL